MPRTVVPKLKTRLVKRSEVLAALGIAPATFWRNWYRVFTDPRPVEKRTRRFERKVFEDELAVAVDSGGSAVAVLNYRATMGRR